MAGFECEFVEPPAKYLKVECPICLHVLREPYQASCCGQNFCKACLDKVSSTSGSNCPCCMSTDFQHFEDKRMKQTLYDIEVHCTNSSKGCEWTGELRYLDEHLNENPTFEESALGCDFTVISCPMNSAGCSVKLPRKEMHTHVSTSLVKHTVMQFVEEKSLASIFGIDIGERKHTNFDMILALIERIETLEDEVAELTEYKDAVMNTGQLLGPMEFTVTNFQKLMDEKCSWCSPTFQSHPLGYKLSLKVTPYGRRIGKGTHLSITFVIEKGEFDDQLDWPFEATISMRLINQEVSNAGFEKEVSLRILKSVRYQIVQFMPHNLLYDEYIKSDCIRLRLTELKFNE